jgi:hypothetical protein
VIKISIIIEVVEDKTDKRTELVQQQFNKDEQDIIQLTELGELSKDMDRDEVDPDSNMSTIDTRARLGAFEMCPVLGLDTLAWMNFLPKKCTALTREKKRLSVSLDGMGRKERVEMAVGKREQDQKKGLMDRFLTGGQQLTQGGLKP